jgi:ribosomal-protein-alanine N-acetyltransferase
VLTIIAPQEAPGKAWVRDPARWGELEFAVDDAETAELVGFLELTAIEDQGCVEIGLGLRPDLTGRGLGPDYIGAAMAFARERWSPITFVLDVFPWNERAIRAYERAGFERGEVYVRTFPDGNEVTFLRMSRPAGPSEA